MWLISASKNMEFIDCFGPAGFQSGPDGADDGAFCFGAADRVGADAVTRVVRLTPVRSSDSDYFCADGELASCAGPAFAESLVSGSVLPVQPGDEPDSGLSGAADALMPADGSLLLAECGGLMFYTDAESGSLYFTVDDGSGTRTQVECDDTLGTVRGCTLCDGILCVATSLGMRYFMREGVGFRYLGESLPAIDCDFSLRREALVGYSPSGSDFPEFNITVPEEGNFNSLSSAAAGCVEEVYEACDGQGLFSRPFFAICALRLKGGVNAMPTRPSLLIPNAGRVMVRLDEHSTDSVSALDVMLRVCRLGVRLSLAPDYERWRGIVEGVDIFVSRQAELAAGGGCGPLRTLPSGCSDFSLSGVAFGAETETPAVDGGRPRGFVMTDSGGDSGNRLLEVAGEYFHIMHIPFDSIAEWSEYKAIMPPSGIGAVYMRPAYVPDYRCHYRLMPGGCATFLSRLTAWGGERSLFRAVADCRLPPRFLFHPDPDAVFADVRLDGKVCHAAVSPRSLLGGSCSFAGYAELPLNDGSCGDDTSVSAGSEVSSALAGNPWVFVSGDVCTVDAGEVRSLRRGFRTSTSVEYGGGFLHAFTSGGVYLMGARKTGAYRLLGLSSSVAVAGHTATAELETGVAFAGECGVYVISGGTVKDVSAGLSACVGGDAAMRTFLKGCRMRYMPATRMLMICGGASSCCVLSLRSGEWCAVSGGARTQLPGSPVTSVPMANRFVSRPMKFGSPEKRKRMLSAALRGIDSGRGMTMCLEGSDNLCDWHLLSRSESDTVSGLGGSGWRFFRVSAEFSRSAGTGLAVVVRLVVS